MLSTSGRRSGKDRGQVAALTGLRGFAALVVVAVHASGPTAYPWFGLHTFGPIALFALSGFLLFQPWSAWLLGRQGRPVLRTYAIRRLLRIFPAWLVTLLLVALIYPPSRPNGSKEWLLSLTLTQTASPAGLRPGLEQAWSLGTELAWYVAVPFLGAVAAYAVRRRGVRPMLAVVGMVSLSLLITAAWRLDLAVHATDVSAQLTRSFWLPAYLVCFVGGAAVSHLMLTERAGLISGRPLRWLGDRPWLVLSLAVGTGAIANSRLGGGWGWVIHTHGEAATRFTFTTLLALVLLIGIASPSRTTFLTGFFASGFMVAVGRWSYSLYLWHLPIREILLEYIEIPAGFPGMILWFCLLLAVSLPVSAASYAFVERPAIAWSKRERASSRAVQQPS